MAHELAKTTEERMAVLEKVVVEGDLSKLTPAERVVYYRNVCESLGLNPSPAPLTTSCSTGGSPCTQGRTLRISSGDPRRERSHREPGVR